MLYSHLTWILKLFMHLIFYLSRQTAIFGSFTPIYIFRGTTISSSFALSSSRTQTEEEEKKYMYIAAVPLLPSFLSLFRRPRAQILVVYSFCARFCLVNARRPISLSLSLSPFGESLSPSSPWSRLSLVRFVRPAFFRLFYTAAPFFFSCVRLVFFGPISSS